jgi:hypothetical protein
VPTEVMAVSESWIELFPKLELLHKET